MPSEPIKLLMAALFVLAMTGFTAAPPVWASGISPMGFFLALFVVSLYAPEAMPGWLIVLLSFPQDAALGAPFGFNGMVALIALIWIGRRARAYQRQAPWFVWLVLAAYLMLVQLLSAVAAGLLGLPVSLRSAGLSWLMTLPFIPVLQWFAQRSIKHPTNV